MIGKNFDPWKRVWEFDPEALLQKSSALAQCPIKLYYPGFHDALSKGRIRSSAARKVTLILR